MARLAWTSRYASARTRYRTLRNSTFLSTYTWERRRPEHLYGSEGPTPREATSSGSHPRVDPLAGEFDFGASSMEPWDVRSSVGQGSESKAARLSADGKLGYEKIAIAVPSPARHLTRPNASSGRRRGSGGRWPTHRPYAGNCLQCAQRSARRVGQPQLRSLRGTALRFLARQRR